MILLPVCFNQLAAKIITHPIEVVVQPLIHLFCEHLFSVFSYEDQMQVE